MSGTQTAEQDEGGAGAPVQDTAEDVASASRLGWKPRDQFTGDPATWKPAKAFLDVAFERPAVLAENYRRLDSRFDRTQRELDGVKGQLTDAISTVQTLTTMMRTSEQRAFDRARREILAEREKAVETGDTAAFKRADQELAELKPPPAAQETGAGAGGATVVPQVDPDIRAFWDRSPWYGYNGNNTGQVDAELTREADGIFFGLQQTRSDLTVEARLAETERRVRMLFPQKFQAPRRADTAAADRGDGAGAGAGNGARQEPSMVTPSGENGGGGRRQTNAYTFAALPKESREAFTKYKRQLDGKGEPLTEKEWAHEYWLQDQSYVDMLEREGKL